MLPNNASNLGQPAQPTGNGEERIDVRGTPLPVTRISRRALLLAGIFGASLGLVVLMLGFGDHSAPRKDGPADENAIRPSGPIESVKDLPQDYSFDVNRLGPRYDGVGGPPAPATRPAGPSAQDQALAQALRELAEQRRKMLEQQQKEQQAALDSPLLFGGAKGRCATRRSWRRNEGTMFGIGSFGHKQFPPSLEYPMQKPPSRLRDTEDPIPITGSIQNVDPGCGRADGLRRSQ
jgi:hypothetical protein